MDVKERLLYVVIMSCTVYSVRGQCTSAVCDSGSRDQTILALLDRFSVIEEKLASEGRRPRNCAEIQGMGFTDSAIYTVYYLEGNVWTPVRVYCDMETAGGGWLVFQRRVDGEEDFYRNWTDYYHGFGDLDSEYWLGNYHLSMLTSSGQYKLRFDLEDFDNVKRYAEYSSFSVGRPRDKFVLSVSGYSGDAGDSFGGHTGNKFSTKDKDHDTFSGKCAVAYKGAWWYTKCHSSNLNGLYLAGNHTSYADGIEWSTWHGQKYSLKFTEMKIKPV